MKRFKQPHIVAPGWWARVVLDRAIVVTPVVDRGLMWPVWRTVDRLSDSVVEFNTMRVRETFLNERFARENFS